MAIEEASPGHLSLAFLLHPEDSSLLGAKNQTYDTWSHQETSCANLPLSDLKLRFEKFRDRGWSELYGHCHVLQIQITFRNNSHQTQTGGSPGLHIQKEIDYQVASFLTVERYKTETRGLGDFGFLLDRDCFPKGVVEEG